MHMIRDPCHLSGQSSEKVSCYFSPAACPAGMLSIRSYEPLISLLVADRAVSLPDLEDVAAQVTQFCRIAGACAGNNALDAVPVGQTPCI